MKYFYLFTIISLCAINLLCAQAPIRKAPFVLGETVEFRSGELNENRILNVYLPATYAQDTLKKYPVIYLLDGSADEDFIHIAGLVQFGTFPWVNTLPESILVGIANVDRKRDFTFPTKNEKDKKQYPTTGGSAHFISFIEKELQPLIESTYRTNATKTLIGQSLGGLLAAEILLKKSALFTHYIIVSPSLWWDDESLLSLEPKHGSVQSVYIGVGKDEDVEMVSTATELGAKFKGKETETIRIFFEMIEGQNHGNILHTAVSHAFESILGEKR